MPPPKTSKPTSPPARPPRDNIVINANQLVSGMQRGVRHSKGTLFAFTVELAQAKGAEFLWRAFVTTDGLVRETTKLNHATPGGAIDELWCKLQDKE